MNERPSPLSDEAEAPGDAEPRAEEAGLEVALPYASEQQAAAGMSLSVHKMSGHKCAEVELVDLGERGAGAALSPADRASVFDAMVAQDSDFPVHARWFLDLVDFTPIQIADEGEAAMCTVIFPSLEIDDSVLRWSTGEHRFFVCCKSDPDVLAVGFYLAHTREQHSALARSISKIGAPLLECDRYFDVIANILSSRKFMAVNRLEETYHGEVYDTTLWHLLLSKSKRWNYRGFAEMVRVLLSREDLDFSHSGWSWSNGDTVSAAELCFTEWCGIAGQAPNRRLWVDTATPRLCLLSACLHVPSSKGSAELAAKQLQALMDKVLPRLKKAKALKKCLVQDLELLGSDGMFPLPSFLDPETGPRVASLLRP